MVILFDFYQSPPKEGEEDELHVYARPVFSKTVGTEELAATIHNRCSLTKGDVLSALAGLGEVLPEKLQDRQRVYLEGIGYFYVTLKCYNIHTPKDMRADNVGFKSVEFRADKHLQTDLINTKARRSPIRSHSAKLSNEEVDRKVTEYLKENPVMTRRNFQTACMMKQGMVLRHIQRLLEEGKIKNIGIKRQPIYVLTEEFK